MQDRFDASGAPKTHSRSILELPKRLPRAPFWCPKWFRNWSKVALTRAKASPSLVSPGAQLRILIQLQIFKFCQAWQGISRRKSFRTGKRTQWLRWGFLQKPKFDSLWNVTRILERLSCIVDTRRFENHMKTFSTWMIDQRLVSVPPCILTQSRQWKSYPMKGNRVIKFAN